VPIQSCPSSTEFRVDRSDGDDDGTSREHHPEHDETTRPFHSALNESITIIVVFRAMDELSNGQQLVTFAIRFTKTSVVGIVVVQIKTQLVRQLLQSTGQVVDVREASELNLHLWLLRMKTGRCGLRCVIVVAVMPMIRRG